MIENTILIGMEINTPSGGTITSGPATGGIGIYSISISQTVNTAIMITANTNKGRATFSAPAGTYISAFSMHANYTDAAGTVIGSSSSSSAISIQLAPSAPTLSTATSITSTGFSISWTAVSPAVGSPYTVSYRWTLSTLSNGTTATVTTTSAQITGQTAGSYFTATVQALLTSGATVVTSAPSNTISVQLAPPAPIISTLTGSTLTNTGFSIQWNNITVPASSPYTLSYTFSSTYHGLTEGTRTIGAAVTTWPFTFTSLANGGTVTNLSITATYTSGALTLSTASNTISSVTIPGLPPLIESFTFTQGGPLTTSPWWPPVNYTWTLSGGTPTSYILEVPGSGTKRGDTISFTEITLTSATSPYSATYSAPTTTWNSLTKRWNPEGFTPRLYVKNTFSNNFWEISSAPGYYYPPGVVTVAFATSSDTQKLKVYIQQCRFATRYTLQQERLYASAGVPRPSIQLMPIDNLTHEQLLTKTDARCDSTSPWRLLGEIGLFKMSRPGQIVINVSNPTNAIRSCTITLTVDTVYTDQAGGARISFSFNNAITQSQGNGVLFNSYNLVNLTGPTSFNFTF
jgi:hypothetical protein